MAEVFRVYFSSKLKKPPDSSISSTSPTVSSSLPSTAQPTSKPGTASSNKTSRSWRKASSTAGMRLSGPSSRVTPKEEPARTGLTNRG